MAQETFIVSGVAHLDWVPLMPATPMFPPSGNNHLNIPCNVTIPFMQEMAITGTTFAF